MKPRAQKTKKNLALKVAIVSRDLTSRETARRAGIGEIRLSQLIGGAEPNDDERRALAKVLRKAQSELFPAPEAVML